MAGLERTPTVSLGKIGDITSVNPSLREANTLQSNSDLAAARVGIQTAGVNAQTGDLLQQQAGTFYQESDILMKPLEKLAATRELIRSNDVLTQAQLAMRGEVAALKSGNTPYLEWVKGAQTKFDEVYASARKAGEAISPASAEFITQHLQGERLRLTGELQSDVIKREANDQLGKLEDFRTSAQQTFFQLPPGQARVDLLNRFIAVHRGSAALGLISEVDAHKEIREFTKFIETNNITDIATEDVTAAIRTANESQVFTPQERQTAIDRAIEVAGTANRLNHLTEAAKAKQLKVDQDTLAVTQFTVAANPNTPIQDIQKMIVANLTNVRIGAIRDEDAKAIVKIAAQREEDLRKGVETKDDPFRVSWWHFQLTQHPELVDPRQILNDPAVSKSAGMLIEKHTEVLDKRHFIHNPVYDGWRKYILAVEPPNSLLDLSKASGASLASEAQRAVNEMYGLVKQAAGPKGIFPHETGDAIIDDIAGKYARDAVARLKEKKPVLGPGPSWADYLNMPVP